VLAIFPMKDDLDRDDKCRVALTAAEEALEAMRDVNELRASAGKAPLSVGIGLHAGSVSYGNIGSQTRLDFTVIGPAVNEVCRIATMCRSAGQLTLTSTEFNTAARATDRSRLVSVGRYALRGVERPQELFTIDRFRGSDVKRTQ
jgi:adenylate cyclase